MQAEENLFENLPFDEAMQIYIDYLKAKRAGNLRSINNLFNQYPDMFQTETLALANATAIRVATLNDNQVLLSLLDHKY